MKQKIQMSLLLVSCFLFKAKAQNQDYYWHGDQQVSLTRIANKYLVEFPEGLYNTISENEQASIGQHLFLNTFLVSDTTNLSYYAANHKVSPTYTNSDAVERYYVSQIVLQFKPNVTETEKAALISSNHLTFIESSLSYDLYHVVGDALHVANAIYESGKVTYANPDFITIKTAAYYPPDPLFSRQWYLYNWGQVVNDGKSGTAGADINILGAWDISRGDTSVTVAILDAGLTSNHPDLPNTRQKRLNGSNFDYTYDGTGDPNNPSPTLDTVVDSRAHGDAVAGIVGATHNNEGIAGIAPNCQIMPIKLPFGVSGVSHLFAAAIDFANVKGAKILNMSYASNAGTVVEDLAILNAIKNNRVVVAATGNNANHAATFDVEGFVRYPGNSHIEGVITVAASDRNNKQANYSPYGDNIEIAAPSNTANPWQISGESFNIYTLDMPGTQYGYNPWRTPLTPSLPVVGEILPSTTWANYHAYTGRFSGTSASTPQVSGVAALMMSVNPCISNFQVKELLQSTADKVGGYNYNWNPAISGQSKELGYGKLNAFKAVKAAQEAYAKRDSDLVYIKDNVYDIGAIGVDGTGGGDKSPDIWVRNTDDGLVNQFHENPEFSLDSPCYVYVRIRNKSCYTYIPSVSTPPKIKLYWSKASSWSSWPSNWGAGSPFLGGLIDSLSMPTILAGQSAIVVFKWKMIGAFAAKTTNACLMARIEGREGLTSNPIKIYAGRLDIDVKENNNIAMRNLTVVDIKPGIPRTIGGSVLVGNVSNDPRAFSFKVKVPNTGYDSRPIITDEAEVKLTFDEAGWDIMERSGQLDQQGLEKLGNRSVLIKNSDISFNNVLFPADTRIPIDFQFNFLMDQQSSSEHYEYLISQSFADTPNLLLGSEHFEINKSPREVFSAYAGEDTTINKGDSIVLNARQISDSAEYNWYDEQHSLLYNGTNFAINPINNKKYLLEVLSLVDGFKDYDEVEVFVRQFFITSISPNPATTQVNIGYDASGATSANIMMVRSNGTTYSTHNLSISQNQVSINTSGYPVGIYNVVLVCDGQVMDTKTLQVN